MIRGTKSGVYPTNNFYLVLKMDNYILRFFLFSCTNNFDDVLNIE
ncbi:hypothetical protein ACJIZ3_003483 [Penstemon smallii]|uniref:Photosystem II protein I n=1 Tax=Penstemon smallii TaxID=265156 RepID=A0ABD3U9R8_9LAMI